MTYLEHGFLVERFAPLGLWTERTIPGRPVVIPRVVGKLLPIAVPAVYPLLEEDEEIIEIIMVLARSRMFY